MAVTLQPSKQISDGTHLKDPAVQEIYATATFPVTVMLMELTHHCLSRTSAAASFKNPALLVKQECGAVTTKFGQKIFEIVVGAHSRAFHSRLEAAPTGSQHV